MALDRGQLMRDNRQISIQLDLLANRALAENDITGVQAHALLYVLRQTERGTSVTELHRRLVGTEKGRQLQGALETSLQGMEDALYRNFSPGELSTLERLQKKMLRNLSATQREATKP